MTQPGQSLPSRAKTTDLSTTMSMIPRPEPHHSDDVSDLSARCSDVEPETTATAARIISNAAASQKTKRSYKTVDPMKRKELIQMVNVDQKTIKEAANRLKINYSTAKHIIKSKKSEATAQAY